MRSLPFVAALVIPTAAAFAQANCSAGPGPITTIATQTPFAGNSLYGHPNFPSPPPAGYTGFNMLWDMTMTTSIDIDRIDLSLYDAGGAVNLGNGMQSTVPNQVGGTAPVTFYILPTQSWVGNEATQLGWAPIGTGTLTVGLPHQDSAIVFNPPLSLPPGLFAVALQVDMTTTGPNPGPLHPMLDPSGTSTPSYSDSVITLDRVAFDRESWMGSVPSQTHIQNIEIHYAPTTGYANWTSYGAGCGGALNNPVLRLSARPVVGTTVDFQTVFIPAGAQFNIWMLSLTPDAAGMSLQSFGLPGCSLFLQFGSGIVTFGTGVTNSQATVSLSIPNDPSLSGLVLYAQSAPLTPTGVVLSDAVCVALGLL